MASSSSSSSSSSPVMKMTAASGGKRLAGKVAVVTASTEGIGLAIARRLGEEGASVMLSSRKQKNVDAAVQQLRSEGLRVAGVVCHVGKADHRDHMLKETVKQFGGIDILVTNAAANPYFGALINTPESTWDKIFETNVKAAFLLCQAAVPLMEERGGGNIVIVGSIAGYKPDGMLGAYSISKTALLGLTKALAPELAHSNIRINCLAPGIIKTNFSKTLWENEDVHDELMQRIPMNRAGVPEECAGVVAFMVSQDAAYMTGETIVVSGGLPCRL